MSPNKYLSIESLISTFYLYEEINLKTISEILQEIKILENKGNFTFVQVPFVWLQYSSAPQVSVIIVSHLSPKFIQKATDLQSEVQTNPEILRSAHRFVPSCENTPFATIPWRFQFSLIC